MKVEVPGYVQQPGGRVPFPVLISNVQATLQGSEEPGRVNVTGSENWETYDDNSEPEADASDTYYAKVRAARGKRMEPEAAGYRPNASQTKRLRAIPAQHAGHAYMDEGGERIVSNASGWTDEEAY
ncbi:hypothetical protein BN1708_018199, partial [Verticillium longisporum]